MHRICCSPEPPAIDTLTPEERQRFGFLVYQLRKAGKDVRTAQEIAFHRVLAESLDYVQDEGT